MWHHEYGCHPSYGLYIRNSYWIEDRMHRHQFTKLVPARSMYIPLTKNSPKMKVLDFSM